MFQKIFSLEKFSELTSVLKDHKGFSKVSITQLSVYIAAFYANFGNFLSFGDSKLIPQLPKYQFLQFLKATAAYSKHGAEFDFIWANIQDVMYSVEPPYAQIGFQDKNGLSGYYSANMRQEEVEQCNLFLQSIGLSPLNTRAFNTGYKHVLIRVASVEHFKDKQHHAGDHTFHETKYTVEYGEFSSILKDINHHLTEASKFADNQNQVNMIQEYLEHF